MRQPLVIDIHAHYYPESYMQMLVQYGSRINRQPGL